VQLEERVEIESVGAGVVDVKKMLGGLAHFLNEFADEMWLSLLLWNCPVLFPP